MKSAPARATLIRHPPEREAVVAACMLSENCRPAKIDAARLHPECMYVCMYESYVYVYVCMYVCKVI